MFTISFVYMIVGLVAARIVDVINHDPIDPVPYTDWDGFNFLIVFLAWPLTPIWVALLYLDYKFDQFCERLVDRNYAPR